MQMKCKRCPFIGKGETIADNLSKNIEIGRNQPVRSSKSVTNNQGKDAAAAATDQRVLADIRSDGFQAIPTGKPAAKAYMWAV